jgi:hypothetical protein
LHRIKLYVMAHEGAWAIRCDGRFVGRFPAPVHAIRVAIEAAMRTGPELDAEILVQGTNNLFRTEWIRSRDRDDQPERRYG